MSNGNEGKVQDSKIITGQDDQQDGNNATALQKLQDMADNAVQPAEFYKNLLGEHLYELWFGEASQDFNNILSDCVSRDKWHSFLDKFKEGKVSAEDVTDALLLSHLHAVERANPVSSPEEIVDRTFESKMKGRLGKKLIASTINTLAKNNLLTAPPEAVTALLGYTAAKEDVRAENQEEAKKLLPQTVQAEKITGSVDEAHADFLNSLNLADSVRDITSDELLARLESEMDPYFGITHQIVFDIGWESVSRSRPDKCLAIYVAELDKAWTDSVESNMKQADRHMTRYLVRDVAEGDEAKIHQIKTALVQKYASRFEEKIDFFKVIWARGKQTV